MSDYDEGYNEGRIDGSKERDEEVQKLEDDLSDLRDEMSEIKDLIEKLWIKV